MEWSDRLRDRCFRSSKDFINNYCSPLTLKELGAVSGDRVNEFRKLARLLTEKFPKAAHFTPGWNGNPNPVVALGNLPSPNEEGFNPNGNNLEININAPRIGLCMVGNDGATLALWAEALFLGVDPNSTQLTNLGRFGEGWSIWRRSKSNNRSLDKFVCSANASEILKKEDFNCIVGKLLGQGNTDQTAITRQQGAGDSCVIETLSPLVIHMRNRASQWFQAT